MAMNKYMHERNIYRKPPNYTDMAISFPEFRKLCTLNLDGSVSIDMQQEDAVRVLTETLLQKDFKLKVTIPRNKLVPTVPLRLNYILWLEDIMTTLGLDNCKGIDIGCGAACIYSILAARKNNWHILAIDINEETLKHAKENVDVNKLGDRIELFLNKDKDTIFKEVFKEKQNQTYDFCICNPPFYPEFSRKRDRKGNRKGPKNHPTGSDHEIAFAGGETVFIKNIISESRFYNDKIRVFSTMVGHKSNATEIKQLFENGNITFIETVFCQGNTTRWGIAWTFHTNLPLKDVPCIQIK